MMTNRQAAGNVMIYILLALALFGGLTLTMARQNDQADSQSIDREKIAIYVQEMLTYVASAQASIDMLVALGADASDLDFTDPTEAGFDTAPHTYKVFHPAGGGLFYETGNKDYFIDINHPVSEPQEGWHFSKRSNVEWSPSGTNDIIMTALYVDLTVCAALNKAITGDATVPVLETAAVKRVLFANYGAADDLDTSSCAACEDFVSLCVKGSSDAEGGAFYTVLLSE